MNREGVRTRRARIALVLAAVMLGVTGPAVEAQDVPAAFVLLGRTQLLDGAKAFGAFCRKHDRSPRSKTRGAVVVELKKIAADEQPKIRKALGLSGDVRSLWIVNALVARLTPEQVEAAKTSSLVKAVFPAGSVPVAGAPGKVAGPIAPAPREPFSARRKTIPWNLEKLRVPRVWTKLGVTGEGALVVSFDQGANVEHEDLRGNIWINEKETPNDGKDDDGNGLIDDVHGYDFSRMRCDVRPLQPNRPHGTWTSSVIVGDGTGGTVTGVAPRAKLMPVIANGGPYCAARAFEYAIEQGGDIVSMSFSIPGLGATRGLWRLLAEHATCAGLVLISGAGNFRRSAKTPVQIRIPEGIPCVICVGGVTKKLKLHSISSTGPVEWASVPLYGDYPLPRGLVKPDVAAFPGPGIGLVSRENEGYLGDNNSRQGNSLSAPQVAGVCALMLSVHPEMTPWRVKELLEKTARDLPPRGKDVKTGNGVVDAYRAVRAAMAETKKR